MTAKSGVTHVPAGESPGVAVDLSSAFVAAGAAGFASSASPTHNGDSGRPVPSRVADLAELDALLQPVKESGRS